MEQNSLWVPEPILFHIDSILIFKMIYSNMWVGYIGMDFE